MTLRSIPVLLLAALAFASPAYAQATRGAYTYKSLRDCQAAGQITPDQCRHAASNSEAEFDEKSPRFSSRGLCEAQFGRMGCSLSIASASGYAGRKDGIFFQPRQEGFRVTVRSPTDVTVVPLARRGGGYRPRTALRAQTERSRQVRIQTEKARNAAATRMGRAGEADMIDLPPLEGPDPQDAGFVPSGAAAQPLAPAEVERRRQRLDSVPYVP